MENIVGIDFGHGETSAGFVISNNVIGNAVQMSDLYIIGEEKVIPSIVCVMPNEETVIAPSAPQIAESQSIGISFKDPLIGNSRYSEITETNYTYFKTFLTKTYDAIKSNPNNPLHTSQNGQNDYLVYIACPSGWDKEQIDAYKEFANTQCSIPVVDIVKESRAAYIAARRNVIGGLRTQGGNVLVIDFGSSTIDFTYFNNGNGFEAVHEGYKLGARMIEERFLQYLFETDAEAKSNISLVKQTCGPDKGENVLLFAIRKLKEEYFSSPNQDKFLLSIDLKKLLLNNSLAGRYIESNSGNGYTKQEVLNILSEYRKKLSDMLDDFLKKDGVTSVDKVILTGGASRMFFFKELVCKKYKVSKEKDTLIVDLNPSVTISQGIAAFGYMNEMSNQLERKLWHDVYKWISEELPKLLRSTIEKSIGNMYYNDFQLITNNYKEGKIVKDGKHSLDGLEDKYIELLSNWSSNEDKMSAKIAEAVQKSIKESTETAVRNFAQTWGLGTPIINIDFSFTRTLSLTVDSCNYLTTLIWEEVKNYISARDFWPFDPSTSPFRERDYSDRSGIVSHVTGILRNYFNDLNYEDDLTPELNEIAMQIKEKVQGFVDEAKLQQYRLYNFSGLW